LLFDVLGRRDTTLSSYYSNETTANYAEAAHWWLLAYKNRFHNNSSLQNILNAFEEGKYQPTDYTDIFSIIDITINKTGFEYLSHVDSSLVIHSYGKFYEKGQGCNVNLEKAFAIQLKNAKDGLNSTKYGFISSMIDLGAYYVDGKGTTKNSQEALRWLTKAIDIDNSFRHMNTGVAMFLLGYMYEYGLGIEKNLGTAKEWYQKSSDALFEPAKKELQKLNN
jgi:TPR repeat protein